MGAIGLKGRGSVVFDMDYDGDLDILVVNPKPVLNYPLSSETRITAVITTLGSRVEIVIVKIKMIREIDASSSHLSQNSTIAHFGLGTELSSTLLSYNGLAARNRY